MLGLQVTDQGMRTLGRSLLRLKQLHLNQCTQLTDGGLFHLAGALQCLSVGMSCC